MEEEEASCGTGQGEDGPVNGAPRAPAAVMDQGGRQMDGDGRRRAPTLHAGCPGAGTVRAW